MGLCVINIASFFYIDKKLTNIENVDCFAKIISINEETQYKNKYIIKVLKNNGISIFENIKLIMYTEKDYYFLPGDIVELKGKFSLPDTQRNFGGFDYSRYLKQSKILGIVEVEKIKFVSREITIFDSLQILRKKLINRIDELFVEENAGFLKSLLFGKSDELSEEIKVDFRNSSISHVLAISGMHFNYIIISLKTILDKTIKNKKMKNNILIFGLIIFLNLTGNPVSGTRACIMGIMVILASNFERKNSFYFSFIYSWIVIIIYNPYNIYNIGCWLSYMGTLGIVLFYELFKKYSYHHFKRTQNKLKSIARKIEFLNKSSLGKIIFSICKYIFDNFLISISAQILIFPIIIYSFNTISFSFFISNILISFFIGPALILGYLSVILSIFKLPFLKIIIILEEFIIQIILNISKVCAKIPFSQIYVVTPKFIYILMFYLIISIFIYFFYNKKIYVLKILCSKKFLNNELEKSKNIIIRTIKRLKINYVEKDVNKQKKIIFLVIFCIVFISVIIFYAKNYEQTLEINFIDVGQGDCTYIKTPKGKNIIIDAGEGGTDKYDYGEKVVLPYLLDKNVKKIDYLVISHADSDHIGGTFSILENMKVEKIIIGVQPEKSEQYERLLKISKSKKINIYHVNSNNRILIEKDIGIVVLWPMDKKFIEENSLNNNSLVFKFYYKDFSILFTGDIEKIAEEKIVKEYEKTNILMSQILKVAHHGSKTSTTDIILEKIIPKIVLIGVGEDNKFGHPNEAIIKKLEGIGARIFRTDINGEINIVVNKNGKVKFKTKF